VSTTELCETAVRSLRGALSPENLREQDAASRYDLMVYWTNALTKAGLRPPRHKYFDLLAFAEREACERLIV
jgi:hypothetical protein